MPDGLVLELSQLTKRFRGVTAVADLSARIEPGLVTGFLGPNGAGKTTTLRILLGLVRATSGSATIGGRTYAQLDRPTQTVGAALEASSFHPGRSGANHLRVYARAAGITDARVDEVLGLVGLADAAGRKVGGYSLGMRQRLGLAAALLGDPGVLVLDEPVNGLDPEGIRWIRGFLRQLAHEGRTVLISSHLLTEVQQTVDALVVISRGRLVFQGGLDELADPSEYTTVVDAPDRTALVAALDAAQIPHELLRSGVTVRGVEPAEVGVAAAAAGVALSGLQRRGPALEEVFLELVRGERVHPSAAGGAGTAAEGEVTEAEAAEAEVAEPAAATAAMAGAAVAEPEAEDAAATAGAETEPEADVEGEAAPEPEPEAEAEVEAEVEAEGEPDAAAETETAPAPAPEAAEPEADVAAEPEAEPVPDLAVEPEPAPDADPHVDVEPEPEPEPEPAAADPTDGDPDVGAVAEVDDALSAAEDDDLPVDDAEPLLPASEDRPFDDYAKTEADLEADAFFAAFDHSPHAQPDAPPDGETPSASGDSEVATDTDADADGGDDAEPETDADEDAETTEGGEPR